MRPGTKPRIAVVDYGMGNLASVAKALERSGADVRVTESAAAVRDAAAVVLPGVGAFRDAAARLEQSGLGAAVLERIAAGTPFLGVCLGLQLLFESSAEGGRWPGLGVFAGTVERLQTGLKVPHIGWNELEWAPAGAGMARGLPAPAAVYFVHSYAALPADPAIVAASTDYGGQVVAAVARDNVWAMQFHPEKSSLVGLSLLANFVERAKEEVQTS
jgi:glutamine amidotransferase